MLWPFLRKRISLILLIDELETPVNYLVDGKRSYIWMLCVFIRCCMVVVIPFPKLTQYACDQF